MKVDITERLTFFGGLYELDQNPELGMQFMYWTVVALTVLVYKLGFAKKLSLWKNIVVYGCLMFGCLILTFFAAFLPIAEGLFFTALFLGIYRFRLYLHRRKQTQSV